MSGIILETAQDPRWMKSLAESVGWNQTLEDCRFLISGPLSIGIYARTGEGEVVGCGGCFTYGNGAYGHIHMIITREDHRGKGIARSIVTALMEKAKCRSYRLYATKSGSYVYSKLGFQPKMGQVKYFAGRFTPPSAIPEEDRIAGEALLKKEMENILTLDEKAFGFSRRETLPYLLHNTPETLLLPEKREGELMGFSFCRRGPRACAVTLSAKDLETASSLLERALLLPGQEEKIQIVLFENQEKFASLLEEKGFEKAVPMQVMDYGAPLPLPSPLVYGIAGGEFG